MEQYIREFPKITQDNFASSTQIFGSFLRSASILFDFPPGISRIVSWMVRLLEIQQLPAF